MEKLFNQHTAANASEVVYHHPDDSALCRMAYQGRVSPTPK